MVKFLLSVPGIDPSVDNNLAIHLAAEEGHLEILELLLSHPSVDPTADNNYAVRAAAENNHLSVVKRLLDIDGVNLQYRLEDTILNAIRDGSCLESFASY